MRKVKVIVEDEYGNSAIAESTIEKLNDLYLNNEIDGITHMLIHVNSELNKLTGNDVPLSIPNKLATIPEGKNW